MTGFQEAVTWFDHWEGSAILGTGLEQRLLAIFNPSISETDRARLLNNLIGENAGSSWLPELLFRAGVHYRRLDAPQNSLPYLLQAIEKYTAAQDLHHLTSLRWLYGCVLWQTGARLAACLHWRQAIEDWVKYMPALALRLHTLDKEIENARLAALRCIELQEWHRARRARSDVGMEKHRFFIAKYQVKVEYLQQVSGELKNRQQAVSIKQTWYQERLNEMNIALAGKPEEAYLLVKDLIKTEPGRLSQGFIDQRGMIECFIAENKLDLMDKEVGNLLTAVSARTLLEKAETYLVCGWALAAGKKDGWEEHLQKAVFLYPPDSLARVWARWLLGACQWDVPEKRGEAANNWRITLNDLTHLRQRAEWQNQPQAVNAYAEKLTAMHGALQQQRNRLATP